MLGFHVYYLFDPFVYILALCPQGILPSCITVVIALKIILAAVIMYTFLRYKSRQDNHEYSRLGGVAHIVCAVTWAMSSFFFAHSMNIMWTDVVLLLPLVIYALERLLDGGRGILYVVSLAAILLLNYYISFQVCIFIVLWAVATLIINGEKHPLLRLWRLCYLSLIAVGLDGVFLIPTALELANSPKDITQLGLELGGKNLAISDILSKMVTLSYDDIEARFGLPQVFCGVLFLILLIGFFTDLARSVREKLTTAVLLGIFIISFCSDFLNLCWHAGMEPSGHPYRQAFMYIFIVIVSCSRFLQDVTSCPAAVCKDVRGAFVRLGIVTLTLIIVFAFALRTKYDHISELTIKINWILLASYVCILAILIILVHMGRKKATAMIVLLLCAMQLADITLSDAYTYNHQSINAQSASEYYRVITGTKEAVATLKDMDTSFYRMENLTPRQQNDAMQYNYNGVTHYSSAGMTYVRYFLQRLGYNDDGLYTHYGHDNTALADSILGVKYVVTDGTAASNSNYGCIYDSSVSAYRNPYALAVAVGVHDYNLDGISEAYGANSSASMTHLPEVDPFTLQEDIYGRITGESVSVFVPAKITVEHSCDSDSVSDEYEVIVDEDGYLYMYLDGLRGRAQGLAIYVEGELLTGYGNASCYKVLNLGYYEAGSILHITVAGDSADAYLGEGIFVTEDMDALAYYYDIASRGDCDITKVSSSHLKISVPDGFNGVFTTIPCEEGWHISVDGVGTEPVGIYDSLMYIPVEDTGASHFIDMYFVPKGIVAGAIVSVLALAVFVVLIVRSRNAVNKAC